MKSDVPPHLIEKWCGKCRLATRFPAALMIHHYDMNYDINYIVNYDMAFMNYSNQYCLIIQAYDQSQLNVYCGLSLDVYCGPIYCTLRD